MLPLRLVVLEFERSASPSSPFVFFLAGQQELASVVPVGKEVSLRALKHVVPLSATMQLGEKWPSGKTDLTLDQGAAQQSGVPQGQDFSGPIITKL